MGEETKCQYLGMIEVDLDTVSLQPAGFLCLGVDDLNKLGLEGCSAHQETINIFLASQLFTGSAGHRALTGGKKRIIKKLTILL